MNKISMLVVAVVLAMAATPVVSFAQSEMHSVIVATDHGMRSSKLIGMAIYDEQGQVKLATAAGGVHTLKDITVRRAAAIVSSAEDAAKGQLEP